MKVDNAVDTVMLLTGSIYSIVNIQEVLGIVILILQAVWLLSKLVLSAVRYYKGEISSEDILEDLEDFKDEIDNIQGDKDDSNRK